MGVLNGHEPRKVQRAWASVRRTSFRPLALGRQRTGNNSGYTATTKRTRPHYTHLQLKIDVERKRIHRPPPRILCDIIGVCETWWRRELNVISKGESRDPGHKIRRNMYWKDKHYRQQGLLLTNHHCLLVPLTTNPILRLRLSFNKAFKTIQIYAPIAVTKTTTMTC